MYRQTTHSIQITVHPCYLDEQSTPEANRFAWSYTVRIENLGSETAQLRSRCWRITDATGRTQQVNGAGVVGEQPVLKPGDCFEYQSGTYLTTASGIMVGSYGMQTEDGREFDVAIPAFSLDSPHQPMLRH
jgi:ApaG protein